MFQLFSFIFLFVAALFYRRAGVGAQHEARPHEVRPGAPASRRRRFTDRAQDHHPAGERARPPPPPSNIHYWRQTHTNGSRTNAARHNNSTDSFVGCFPSVVLQLAFFAARFYFYFFWIESVCRPACLPTRRPCISLR